jgi:DNA-binding SARP family transcriptional activator
VTVVCGVRVTLLDGFGIHRGTGVPPTAVGEIPHGVQRLVAHLCLCGRPSRSAIAGLLWPEVSEEHAHASLRSALWRLHKVVPDLVQVSGHSLSLAPGARVDVRELDEWARRVDDPRSCLDDLAPSHVGLGEELLTGWYDDWVLLERERLRQLRMHALESVAERFAAAGRHG